MKATSPPFLGLPKDMNSATTCRFNQLRDGETHSNPSSTCCNSTDSRGLKLRQARSTFTYCEPEFPIVEEELITKVNLELGVTAERAARYTELARQMDEEIQSLWDTQEPPRLIHNDLHPEYPHSQ